MLVAVATVICLVFAVVGLLYLRIATRRDEKRRPKPEETADPIALQMAHDILKNAGSAVFHERYEKAGDGACPQWSMLYHAERYIEKQLEASFRYTIGDR